MGIATPTQSASNTMRQLSDGNDQGTCLGIAGTLPTGLPDKIGFFGSVTTQPTSAQYATMQTAGSTTALYTNSATTGGVGATQYTFGDIVTALKNLGAIAS